jgi:probable rRNA maturation factor
MTRANRLPRFTIMMRIEAPSKFPRRLLERAARAALESQSGSADVELTIVLTDDSKIRALNREYLGIDAPTDVLSFPAAETDPGTGARYLGDIVISMPYAANSAKKAGHPVEAEVQLLVVHGILHLLGYDHAGPREKAKMWKAQAAILGALGLSDIKIREE